MQFVVVHVVTASVPSNDEARGDLLFCPNARIRVHAVTLGTPMKMDIALPAGQAKAQSAALGSWVSTRDT